MNPRVRDGIILWILSLIIMGLMLLIYPPNSVMSWRIAIIATFLVTGVWPVVILYEAFYYPRKRYIIKGHYDWDDRLWLYWSNEDGWGHLSTATVFSKHESLRLPEGATGLVWLNWAGRPDRCEDIPEKTS